MPINADEPIGMNQIYVDNGFGKQFISNDSRIEFHLGDKMVIVTINANGNLNIEGSIHTHLSVLPMAENRLQIQLV